MELHQLRYFVAVAETGSFSRAAAHCNISQPSLSQQILKLEDELGKKLFDRLGRKTALTDAGHALLPNAKSILSGVQDIKRGFADDAAQAAGQISAGFIPTMAPFLVPPAIRSFRENFPDAKLYVCEDLTESLIEALVAAELDVCFMSLPIANPLIETEELATEPLLVAAPENRNLGKAHAISTDALETLPFVALDEVHCLGTQIQAFCYERSLTMEIVCHATQLSTVQNCIDLGLGVSLVPAMWAATYPSRNCKYIPVRGEQPQRKVVAAWRKGRLHSFLARQFVHYVQQECNRLLSIIK